MGNRRYKHIPAILAALAGVVLGFVANPELQTQAAAAVASVGVPDPTQPVHAVPASRARPLVAAEQQAPPVARAVAVGPEFQPASWDQAILPPAQPLLQPTQSPTQTPGPTPTRAPWAIPVRIPMDGWIARPRPARDERNAVTRLDPSSVPSSIMGITFAGPELTAAELLTGERLPEGAVGGPTAWTVEVAYASDRRFDEVVTEELLALQKRGFRVILRVDYARKQPIPPVGDRAALDEYVATFVRLHHLTRGQVRYFLVGNEGNVDAAGDDPSRVTECLGGREVCAPEWYVQVYRAVRAGLRSSTDAYLIVGAPSPGTVKDPTRWTDGASYLRKTLALLHPLEVDAVALHAYGAPADAPDGGLGQFTTQLRDQLRIVEEAGYVSTPVFVTEINQESVPDPAFLETALRWIDEHNRRSAVDVVAACWFVYHDADGSWPRYALEKRTDMLSAVAPLAGITPGR